jgi:CPA2 family monovalent cation:H+ antiporter-2
VEHGLIGGAEYQLFLAVSVLTMAATPLMMALAPRLADALDRSRQRTDAVNASPDDITTGEAAGNSCEDGLLIIGYGLNGRNLHSAAFAAGIPVSIIEMNPDTVRTEAARGVPILFGDASQDAVLLHSGLREARVAVIAISDPAATARITERIRALHPSVHVIARTRFTSEVPRLFALGADEVIPEEFETAVEIFARTLRRLDIDEREIARQVRQLRDDGYAALRKE